MKILHIVPSYYPAYKFGGPISSTYLLNKYLVKIGVQVDVLTTNAGLENKITTNEWSFLEDIKIKYISYIGYEHFNFSLKYLKEVFQIIKDYDIVHITAVWNFPVFAGCVAAILNKKPFVLSPTGALNIEAVESDKANIKKFYYRFFLKKLFKRATFHFTSDFDYERFLLFNKNDVERIIIPNGFEIEEYVSKKKLKPVHDEKRKYILFLGRLDKIKGLELLLRSLSALYKKYDNLDIVLAGPDNENYKKKLEQLVSELSLGGRVIFPGMLDFNQKLSALKGCEFLILPSYSENFGNVVIEALLCRKAVIIGKNVGVSREIISNNAGLVTGYDPDELAKAIERLLTDINFRNEIADNGFNFACGHYDINRVASQMLTEYKKKVLI